MNTNIVAGVLLVILGAMLTTLSIPYVSENVVLGWTGVASGILMILSSIKPFLAARSKHVHRRP